MADAPKNSFESEFATKAIAKAWSDPAYKARLLADPQAALAEVGVSAPENLKFKVVENTADVVHLILPPPPSGELSEESLALVSGGWIPAAMTLYPSIRINPLANIQKFGV